MPLCIVAALTPRDLMAFRTTDVITRCNVHQITSYYPNGQFETTFSYEEQVRLRICTTQRVISLTHWNADVRSSACFIEQQKAMVLRPTASSRYELTTRVLRSGELTSYPQGIAIR